MNFFQSRHTISSLLPLLEHEHTFTFLRSYLLNRSTNIEHEIASRIASTISPSDHNDIDDPLVRAQIQNKSKSFHNLIVHYTHEARLDSYKKDIHKLWHHIFVETPVMNTKLIIGHRNNRNNKSRLVHPRPHCNNYQSLLQILLTENFSF
jgi:hypothetical protein